VKKNEKTRFENSWDVSSCESFEIFLCMYRSILGFYDEFHEVSTVEVIFKSFELNIVAVNFLDKLLNEFYICLVIHLELK
jgi:hypothetical protein